MVLFIIFSIYDIIILNNVIFTRNKEVYMNCKKCGAELNEIDNICPNCDKDVNLADTGQIEVLRENIVKTSKMSPDKVKEIKEEKVEIEFSEGSKTSADTKDVSKIIEKVFEELNDGDKVGLEADDNKHKKSSEKVFKENNNKNSKKFNALIKEDLVFVRFLFAAVMIAFGVSLFFQWFSISGDAVNIGICRDGHMEAFLEDEVKDKKVEELHGYKGAYIKFTPFNMIIFARSMKDKHLKVMNAKGEESTSLASKMNKYYMYAMILLFVSVLFSVVAILINDKLKYINFIWALSIANAIVIGLNYLAMKLAFFNVFAIKAKSVLKARDALASVKISYLGVTFNDKFFSYNLTEEKGFYISLALLLAWFLMSTVLKELRYRKINQVKIEKENL